MTGERKIGGLRCHVTPGFCLMLAFLLFVDEGHALALWIGLAALCHELGHLAAARLLGLEVRSLTLSAMGAELDISRRCSYGGEVLLLSCGPLVNLALAAIFCHIPHETAHLFAGVNLLLSLFNLLPVPPLDGGELVQVLAAWLLSGRTGWVLSELIADLTAVTATGAGVWLALRGNPSMLVLGLWLLLGRRQRSFVQRTE